jgi:hypothetical protein
VNVEAINEYLKLGEELDKHGLSTHDIGKLLNLLLNAREYQFDAKKISGKLRGIQRLEKKEKHLRGKCEIVRKQTAKYTNLLSLVEEIAALQISVDELIAFKIAINQATKMYNLPFVSATMRLIEDIIRYNKISDLKKELSALYFQKHTLDEACSRQSQSLGALAKIKRYGLSEDRILRLNSFLEENGIKSTS